MGTYEDAMRQAAVAVLCEHPEWGAVAYEALATLRAPNTNEIDGVIFQYFRQKPDHLDALWYELIRHMATAGKATIVRIPLGTGPASDARRDLNIRLLSASLPPSLEAVINPVAHGPGDGDDGILRWHNPLTLSDTSKVLAPRSVPIEIGLTSAATTYKHIIADGGLARWPYDSQNLWLFVVD